jgi:hypothetical protein
MSIMVAITGLSFVAIRFASILFRAGGTRRILR